MRIGIYGGSFDPIHLGHISLAVEMIEAHSLDAVWFCPAYINPFRQNTRPAANHHRLAMVELALTGHPNLAVILHELERPPPSYTVETLRALSAAYRDVHFFLLLGADSCTHFHLWRSPMEILSLATPLIGQRCSNTPFPLQPESPDNPIRQALFAGLTPTRTIEISSTEIRERICRGMRIDHLVPSGVLSYINHYGLYHTLCQ